MVSISLTLFRALETDVSLFATQVTSITGAIVKTVTTFSTDVAQPISWYILRKADT